MPPNQRVPTSEPKLPDSKTASEPGPETPLSVQVTSPVVRAKRLGCIVFAPSHGTEGTWLEEIIQIL